MTRRAVAGLMIGAIALSLAACQKKTVSVATTVPTMPEQTQSSLTVVQFQGSEELRGILDRIDENVFPGTAGCTLNSVAYTVELLDWCKTARVSESELRDVMEQWLQGRDQKETAQKLELVMETGDLLLGPTAQDLLDTAGCQTESCPWPDSCRQIMETMMDAAGVEKDIQM